MIEMLGVLAIIGVLSIGGLYIYRQAMTHYRFNQLLDFMNRIDFAVRENCVLAETCKLQTWDPAVLYLNRPTLCAAAGQDFCDDSTDAYVNYPYIPKMAWTLGAAKHTHFASSHYFFNYVPPDLCVKMVEYDYPNLYWIFVNTSTPTYDVQADGKLSPTQKKELKDKCFERRTAWIGIMFTIPY